MDDGIDVKAGCQHRKCSQKLLQFLRKGYVILGILCVCYGFYITMSKVKDGHLLVNEKVLVLKKYTYPSVTFCYKFKHGNKAALENYYPYIYEQGKTSGIPITHTHTHKISLDPYY